MVFGELSPRSGPGLEFGDIFLEGANGARFGGAILGHTRLKERTPELTRQNHNKLAPNECEKRTNLSGYDCRPGLQRCDFACDNERD